MLPTLLICEDDPLYAQSLQLALEDAFRVNWAPSLAALQALLPEAAPAVVLLDLFLERANDGFMVLQRLRRRWPQVPVLVHSGRTDAAAVVQAMRLGARDYLPKGCSMATLRQVLQHGLAPGRDDADMVGSSPALEGLRRTVARIRGYPGGVVILGESGVGKELVARALQVEGAPFVAVDAATIQHATAESRLFGHERGAFTGAEGRHRGLLEAADGGILYFDEVANMSLGRAGQLLRAVQEQEITRLGGSRSIRLSFRVVCASHEDLTQLCGQGRFRYDLLMRLSVFTLEVPPLRQRQEDIASLVRHFLGVYGGAAQRLTEAAMARLLAYGWPGNVRELANTVQFALAMAEGAAINVEHLPPRLAAASALPAPACEASSFAARVRAFERQVLTEAYALAAGNVSRLARQLQMDRSHLYAKLRDHAIHVCRRP